MAFESEGFRSVCRTALIIINSICCVAGLALIGAGIYLMIYKSDLLSDVMFIRLARPACAMIIATGCLAFVTSFFGIFGARQENLCCHFIYLVIISFIGILALVAAIFAIVNKSQYTDWIRTSMRDSLQLRYGVDVENNTQNAYETRMWDMAQQAWYCCGAEDNSWGVYRSSVWYDRQPGRKEDNNRPMVPPSCCVIDQYGVVINLQKCQLFQNGPPFLSTGQFNEAIFYSGCYTYGISLLQRASGGIIAMGFIVGFLYILAIIFSLGFLMYLCKTRDKTPTQSKAFMNVHYAKESKPSNQPWTLAPYTPTNSSFNNSTA
jgi:hypothetical protein